MKQQDAQRLMKLEVAICFALPVWSLLVGAIFLPVTIMGTIAGASVAAVHALCTVAGICGVWALYRSLKYCFSSVPTAAPNWRAVGPLGFLGLLALWTQMTGFWGFIEGYEPNWFSAFMTIPPTVCAIHILFVAMRKYRPESPRKAQNA
jgi:uncharacterized membrane protein YuzA (DUF378 family)